MRHRASGKFWAHDSTLPSAVQAVADKNFQLLKADPRHPSLHFKMIGTQWAVRVGDRYRALGLDDPPDGVYWYWIGTHSEYNRLVGRP